MVSKINLKARIERHSRILKDNLGNINTFRVLYNKFKYNIVLFLVVFLFPIYPLFSSFFYDTSTYDFYRGNIDESSILDSYNDNEENTNLELISKDDTFLSINTFVNGSRDLSGYNEVINYQVLPGESFSSIAFKFGVSNSSILWANSFDNKKVIKPGEIIKIPPVSGIIHKVEAGETISFLAGKYKISEEKILLQNGLQKSDTISNGQVLIMPGAKKEEPKQIPLIVSLDKTKKDIKDLKNIKIKTNKEKTLKYSSKSEYVDDDDSYDLVKRKPKWTFYWGNCTRYVAHYKNVNWSGNAKEWLRNAREKGHATGDEPLAGSIVVFNGYGYNPVYGHVGIVVKIDGDNIIVKDMNYRRLNEVTVRKVPINDRAIKGYIYVD